MFIKTGFRSLLKGDIIGVPSVSGAVNKEEAAYGKSILEKLNYRVQLADNIFDSKKYLSGDDASRIFFFEKMVRNKDIKALLFARGGYGNIRIIDKINFNLFKDFRKPVLGYSDNSILLNIIYDISGLKTFHCSNLSDIYKMDTSQISRLFSGEIKRLISENPVFLSQGKARGILKGGNLTSIASLCGTGFFPELTNSVLFLEDINEPLYKIDRALAQIRLCLDLSCISGVIAGDFINCGDIKNIFELLKEYFPEIPLVYIKGFGHGESNNPLIIGQPCILDSRKKIVSYEEV